MSDRLRRNSGMTVGDLIERLQQLDAEAPVFFVCDYGDYCHTQQALPVNDVEVKQSSQFETDSGYSNSGIALKREHDDDLPEPETDEQNGDDVYDVVTLG